MKGEEVEWEERWRERRETARRRGGGMRSVGGVGNTLFEKKGVKMEPLFGGTK